MESDKIYKIRHSLAHILAAVVQNKYPEAQFGVGPVIDDGFYYDILLKEPLKLDNLKVIEKNMRQVRANSAHLIFYDSFFTENYFP